ncbi:MAG: gentisate 1,2-dioxygenase [Alphaproteobacteria bacterium]|nr:gentisate 1,2-dioxygenase [Alphaproteobacteria bacterium]
MASWEVLGKPANILAMDRQSEFHERIGGDNLAALWVARRGMDLTRPASPAEPVIWPYDEIRCHLIEAGDLVSAGEAFRRVLVLENPAFKGRMQATNTLYAGLQLVLPGETAPCHRHSQTAIRFVIEGAGGYTAVDGERIPLSRGDFVITPNWTWHDHGNRGDAPVIWLDVLDTPLVGFLDTVFRENYPKPLHPIIRNEGETRARYGAGMIPVDFDPSQNPLPLTHYPYAESRAALTAMADSAPPDPTHGLKMQYTNPATGAPATPTMAAFLQHLPKGFIGQSYRSTESTVVCVAEGRGRSTIDGVSLEWGPGDVFVVPGWLRHRHEAEDEAVLFSVSDRPVQQALGLWREERHGGGANL